MNTPGELGKRIERERKKVAELRNEILRRESFLQGLLAAQEMLSSPNGDSGGKETLRAGGDVMKTQKLLSSVGKPLHLGQILQGIGKEDTKANRASLGSSLARYARKGEIFQRGPNPNEFTVITSAGSQGSSEEDVPDVPPLFGASG